MEELRELTGLPSELLVTIGEVTAFSGQIEHILTMTIKRISNLSWDDAFKEVEKCSRDDIRKKIKCHFSHFARKAFGDVKSEEQSKCFNDLLDIWFNKSDGLARKRDDVIHCCWSIKDGQVTNTRNGKLLKANGKPYQTADARSLANNLKQFLFHLNRVSLPEGLSGPPEEIAKFPPNFTPNYVMPGTLSLSSTAQAMSDMLLVFTPKPSGD